MENPDLNKTVTIKLQKVKDCLNDLRMGLKDRWIATDSHLYQRVQDSVDNVGGVFNTSFEDFAKAEEAYKVAEEASLAKVVDVKMVKHPKTGEMVPLRIRKPQVKMAPSMQMFQAEGRWGEPVGEPRLVPCSTHSNEELLAEHVASQKANGAIFAGGKFIPNPFISDGFGLTPNDAPVAGETPTDLSGGTGVDFANSSTREGDLE